MADFTAVVSIKVANNLGCQITVPERLSNQTWHAPDNLDQEFSRAHDLVEVCHKENCSCPHYANSPFSFLGLVSTLARLNSGMAQKGMSFDTFVLCIMKHALGIPFPESEQLKWHKDV